MTGHPRYTDDTADIIDTALAELATRRRVRTDDPLAAIALITSLVDQAESRLPANVSQARDNGATWRELARALGTSPRASPTMVRPRPADRRAPLAPTRELQSNSVDHPSDPAWTLRTSSVDQHAPPPYDPPLTTILANRVPGFRRRRSRLAALWLWGRKLLLSPHAHIGTVLCS